MTKESMRQFYSDLTTLVRGLSQYYGEPTDNSTNSEAFYSWATSNCSVKLMSTHKDKDVLLIVQMTLVNNKKVIDDF